MDHVAVVTGAGHGLGAAIARQLHDRGYRVMVADIDEAAAKETAAELDASGNSAVAAPLDVRKKTDFESLRDQVVDLWGGADVLVNNAGRSQTGSLMDIAPEEFSDIVEINLNGAFLGCQVFGRYFAQRGYGRIVNIASLAGQNGGTATGAHYAAAKGGVGTLTKVFARELAASGVTVNAVSPGPLDLPVVRETVPADKLAAILTTIPVGTLGSPDFIAETVALLASPAAASVTGACWDINGGLYMR
ncbi:SDR family NAD(P)-dependent oxidoreductase [Rhodococcus jostii]|uniref:3-oxoacyl-[acyl-carrier-protein] reductase MabA n=1 Tax=Rhodococcus jostii TaxID=132919 RepID=A0A1H5FES5_RHOJO|nr:SDR family NAD(P)-dependent oxidoreductase [Rhodococcus jostii]SEE01876.1 3-oxoacyl-[acyl-carrier protein] reductase [Rhodococcus jostii]